ncbi:MAG: zf-HC2 domain-containing protein [Bryobacterales bacterium]
MTVIRFDDAVCRKVRQQLHAYLSNELSVETAAEVDRHLKSCPKCAEELAQMERLRTLVRKAAESEETPAGLRDAVAEALGRDRRRRSASWWGIAAAAAVAVLVAGSFWTKRETGFFPHQLAAIHLEVRGLVSQVAAAYAPAVIDHLRCTIFGPKPDGPVAPEKAAMGLGDEAPLVEIVTTAAGPDASLLVAHRCTFGGREFIHLVLQEGENIASVVLTKRRDGEDLGPGLDSAKAGRFQIAGFEAGDYLAFVISDLPQERNMELARAMLAPVRAFLG